MGKNSYTYWSSMGKKPKKFSFVKGSSMTYTYEVPIMNYRTQIDIIYIVVKMQRDDIAFGVKIDDTFVIDYLKKEIGGKFTFEQNFFQRDGASFPFVSHIDISNTDEYLQYKTVRQRRLKLEQIKNKLK